MGARPLRRTIEQYLEDPLAEKLLLYPNEGRRCLIKMEGDHLIFIDEEVFPLNRESAEAKEAKEKGREPKEPKKKVEA